MSGSSPPLLLIPDSGFVVFFIHSRKELACAGGKNDASCMQCESAVKPKALSRSRRRILYSRYVRTGIGGDCARSSLFQVYLASTVGRDYA